MATIRFEVKSDTPRYWLAVDDKDVPMTNNQGSVTVGSGEHILFWHMVGNPGDSISIVGTVSGHEVVNVGSSKIPDDSNRGAGYRRFTV